MTYKLEPGLSLITSPIKLIFPDHTESYSSGEEVCRAVFDHKYVVREIRAAGDEPLCPVAGSECPGKKVSEEKDIKYA